MVLFGKTLNLTERSLGLISCAMLGALYVLGVTGEVIKVRTSVKVGRAADAVAKASNSSICK